MSAWCWVISPFYYFCSFWSMAVNTIDKLQFLSFIFAFAVLLSVTAHFIALKLGRTIMHQDSKILLKYVQMILDISRYLYFPDGNWPPCWILKASNFICWQGRKDRGTSPCQIFLKLVYPKQRYCDFSIFKLTVAAIFDFLNREILSATGSRESRRISMPNIVKICQSVAKILRVFNFLKQRPPPCWIFKFVKFHWQTVSERPRLIILLNVLKIGRSIAEILRFFRIFKLAFAAILDFWNHEILLAIWMQRVQTHQRAKFHQNRSIGCEHIKIFRFFNMAAAAILDCRIRKILLANGVWRAQTHNFVQIGRSVAEILRFFEFSKWPPPPSWICLRHIWTTHSEYLGVFITLQNLVMIDAVVFVLWTF